MAGTFTHTHSRPSVDDPFDNSANGQDQAHWHGEHDEQPAKDSCHWCNVMSYERTNTLRSAWPGSGLSCGKFDQTAPSAQSGIVRMQQRVAALSLEFADQTDVLDTTDEHGKVESLAMRRMSGGRGATARGNLPRIGEIEDAVVIPMCRDVRGVWRVINHIEQAQECDRAAVGGRARRAG